MSHDEYAKNKMNKRNSTTPDIYETILIHMCADQMDSTALFQY